MTDFAWTDYEQRHNDLEERRDREARFVPPEDRWWEVVTPEEITASEERKKQDDKIVW